MPEETTTNGNDLEKVEEEKEVVAEMKMILEINADK